MMNNNIKWACIQPLTGGIYLGTEEAIGHPAEWILSFKGLNTVQHSKTTGKMTSVGNEYNLLEYLNKHNRNVPYYQINCGMFDIDVQNTNPRILLDNEECTPNYNDLDLIIGLPVCSGLSVVTTASKETKDTRNCNMQWMANYALSIIKPKVYVFENAPTLMGARGDELRSWFNNLALRNGYSILYYKTDTVLHDNCQKRPRTFIIFTKHNNDVDRIQNPQTFDFYSNSLTVKEYLDKIPDNLTQMISIKTAIHNKYVIDYMNSKYNDSWKTFINGSIMDWINKNKLIDDLISFIESNNEYSDKDKEKSLNYIKHIKYKRSLGLNYYGDDIQYIKDYISAVQFRSMPNLLHLTENRIYTIREYLSFMGMPYDFELYGGESNFPKIGQNVPVNTMKFIVNQIIDKILLKWNDERKIEINAIYQNNIRHTIENEKS